MGRKLEIDWQETASELKKCYRKEHNSERQTRLHAFLQLRCEIEQHLRRLNADKGHVKSLIEWQWIQDAFAQLSA